MLKEIVNRPELKIVYDKTKPDIPTTVILNCYKAKDILGWTPKISVHDGLKQTVDWYVQ